MYETFAGGIWPETAKGLGQRLQSLLAKAVFSLDRQLQIKGGVFEYSSDPLCIFRISYFETEAWVSLENGADLAAGSRLICLHLWNEQIPVLSKNVTAMAWGLRMSRALAHSLRLLSAYLANKSECDGVRGLRADMVFGPREETPQLLRICGHFGFAPSPGGIQDGGGNLHRFGENVLVSGMVIARNASALRASTLRRSRVRVYLTREELDRRFGVAAVP